MTLPLMDALALAAMLAVTGVFAGVLAGLLGVGGGIVMVPVLFHVLSLVGVPDDLVMLVAVGTSLCAMVPTSLRSAMAHHAKGAVDLAMLRLWAPVGLTGAVLGVWIAPQIGGSGLTLLFAVVAGLAALNMLFGASTWRVADNLPGPAGQGVMAWLIAFVSVMMGIGGGTLSVPVLTLFGYPIHRAVGTASAFGLAIAVPGAIGFLSQGWDAAGRPPFSIGYVSLLGVALIVPTTVLSAPWGVWLAHRLNRVWLSRAFAVFLLLTSARMLLTVLG